MVPKTRLDRLVTVRERSEESALENLARAQTSLGRASERLAGLRRDARSDGRGAGDASLWALEETAHLRTLQAIRSAERDVAVALRVETEARAGYGSAHRDAEAARRIQGRKRSEIVQERERRDQGALDEAATLRFNANRR